MTIHSESTKSPGLVQLEQKMASCWAQILGSPLAKNIEQILCTGDRRLYALWLSQVAHLTRHTSAHQALVGTRVDEISFSYAKFCFEHAAEEVGHEMMAIHDLRKIGVPVQSVADLPEPMLSTQTLNSYLYFVSERAHPATRLGFSYWAEKCYPFINELASKTKTSLGLADRHMTFFVSHGEIDAKHAQDVERIVSLVCKTPADWQAVEIGMAQSLNLATQIFAEIYDCATNENPSPEYRDFLNSVKASPV